MKLKNSGRNTSEIEVQDISKQGVWLYVKGKEYLLLFEDFPWFKDAKVSQIYHLQLLHEKHLYWPDLDIDIDLDSIRNLKKYPFVYQN